MNDAYAWGIWKTFNVMTLTAGSARSRWAWRHGSSTAEAARGHANRSGIGLSFYATGLFALGFDVGRPWNFYSSCCPGAGMPNRRCLRFRYACHCTAPSFCFLRIFPGPRAVLLHWHGPDPAFCAASVHSAQDLSIRDRRSLRAALMHQSSLGGLLLLAGNKINPLWQTPFLPLLYLLAAGLCGLGFVIFLLLVAGLRYSRRSTSTCWESWQPVVVRMFSFSRGSRRGSALASQVHAASHSTK